MNNQPSRRIDPRTAEQLLSGAPMGARHPHPPLAAVLTAAAAPGRPGELTSEDASASAFRTAAMRAGGQRGRLSVIRTAVMKVLTVKVIAVAVATTTVGGVALAAGAGRLPNPLTPPAPAGSAGFSAAHPAVTTRGPGKVDGSTDARKSRGPSAAPSPALVGLCHAYLAGNNKNKRDKILADPAFSPLVTAAGGTDKVDGFCRALLAATPSASSGAGPNAGSGPGKGPGNKKGSGDNEDSGDNTGNNTRSGNNLSTNSTAQPAASSRP